MLNAKATCTGRDSRFGLARSVLVSKVLSILNCHMEVATAEGREASRSRASDSPLPGRVSRMPANATTGRSAQTVSGAGERSAADERPGHRRIDDRDKGGFC